LALIGPGARAGQHETVPAAQSPAPTRAASCRSWSPGTGRRCCPSSRWSRPSSPGWPGSAAGSAAPACSPRSSRSPSAGRSASRWVRSDDRRPGGPVRGDRPDVQGFLCAVGSLMVGAAAVAPARSEPGSAHAGPGDEDKVDRPGFFGDPCLPNMINLPFFPAARSSFPRILSAECTCRRSAGAQCYTSRPIPGSRA